MEQKLTQMSNKDSRFVFILVSDIKQNKKLNVMPPLPWQICQLLVQFKLTGLKNLKVSYVFFLFVLIMFSWKLFL